MTTLRGDASACDDWAWIELEVEGDIVSRARGEGDGAVELCEAVLGQTALRAAAQPGQALVLDALHAALAEAVTAAPDPDRVLVAMSGGVDSAMALQRVLDDGKDAVGVTLRLWVDPDAGDSDRSCCSPSSARAARALCHQYAVPHVTLDRRASFRSAVVEPYISAYAAGDTPNPCSRCNSSFRFAELEELRRRLGAARLATGHYARIIERDGSLHLARGDDRDKDQSYMLAGLDEPSLATLCFPLGEQRKGETRAQARALGLAAADRPESQEACFLGGEDYRRFLERSGVASASGEIVHADGTALGSHKGHWRFTPGQRRGLALGGSHGRLYVIDSDAASNTVVVGPHELTRITELRVQPGRLRSGSTSGEVQVRHRSAPVPGDLHVLDRGFRASLAEPVFGVARGQVAVAYDGDLVVGAGLIENALA